MVSPPDLDSSLYESGASAVSFVLKADAGCWELTPFPVLGGRRGHMGVSS